MKAKKFPEFMFVSRQGNGEDAYWLASEDAIYSIEDDGPTIVGTYQLVERKELSKRVVSKSLPHRLGS